MKRISKRRLAVATTVGTLAITGTALGAFGTLPSSGDQVNNDLGAGINPANPVSTEDPANADVVGGALTAGKPNVPWAIFRQTEAGSDQIFVRSFAAGAWSTRGAGTVGGHSSAAPTFSGSLNFDQGVDGEAPAIDFAGTGRTVPWATWYENTTAFSGTNNIFASRFDGTQNKWVFAGQTRTGTPSLNIHTNQPAENPSVAGGSTANPAAPGPWVTWQENGAAAPGLNFDQIFVVRPMGPGSTNCTGVKPAADDPNAAPLGGFCWQQVGTERLGTDPSLNVDRTRSGIEPDIAFTGTSDSVPWVVWYEVGTSGDSLHSNDMVFAAKGVAPTSPTGVDGGLNWIAVGRTGQGVLDNSTHGGPCGVSTTAEEGCAQNADPNASAVDPRIAAGTMTPGAATAPWVAWEEAFNGHERIFASHLVSGQFKLANGGQPLPTLTSGVDASRPDITFSGNTPYVTWHEGGNVVAGHFTTPDSFVIDNGPVGANAPTGVRAPVSSGCTANPFNVDGSTCQGNAIGTPFFLFTDHIALGGNPAIDRLFGDAYQPDAPFTGTAIVTPTSAALTGSVNPQGARVNVGFEFGPTTAYGQTTPAHAVGPSNSTTPFTAAVNGLAPSTTYHYRALVSSDFGSFVGQDQVLTTAAANTPPPKDTTPPTVSLRFNKSSLQHVARDGVLITITNTEAGSVKLTLTTRIPTHHKRRRSGAQAAAATRKITLATKTVSFSAAGTKKVTLKLSAKGRRAIAHLRKVKLTLTAVATDAAGNTSTRSASATFVRRR